MKVFICLLIFFLYVFNCFAGGQDDEDLSNPGPFLTEEVESMYNLGLKFAIDEQDSSIISSIDGIVYRFSKLEDNSSNFGRFLELESSDTYFYNGEEKLVKFYILYSNLLEVFADKEGEQIDRGTEIGLSGGTLFDNNLLICIYTFEKDPYISYLTKSVSSNLLNTYWYDPMFLFNEEYNTFNYFKYEEIDLKNYIETLSDSGEDSRTIEILEKNIRFFITFDTPLSEITEQTSLLLEAANNSLSSKFETDFLEYYKHSTEYMINDTKLILVWPEDFDLYLSEEIEIGNDLYIYGMISTYNHYDNTVLVLVGDFTTDRLENLIDKQYGF